MSNVSLAQSAALTGLSQAIYEFLPGTPHPYGNPELSFPAVARAVGLESCWPARGSKRQGIKLLIEGALGSGRLTKLVTEIVKRAMVHHKVTRQEIEILNSSLTRVGFRIPELTDPRFLDGLASADTDRRIQVFANANIQDQITNLLQSYRELRPLDEVSRGFAFEKFLSAYFDLFGLAPRGPFRRQGEQIDGSFSLASEVYLLSARWRAKPANRADLIEFSGMVGAKARWSRGLFVSQAGFSQDGLEAYAQGHQTNIVCMSGRELAIALEKKLSLPDVILAKVRRAAETNEAFVPAWILFEALKES